MPTELGFRPGGSLLLFKVNDLNPLPVNMANRTSSSDSVLARLGDSKTVNASAVSTDSSTTVVLSYTVPADCQAYVSSAWIYCIAAVAVPTVRLRYTPNGGVVEVLSQTALTAAAQTTFTVSLHMLAGDVLDWYVLSGGTTSTADIGISVVQTTIY